MPTLQGCEGTGTLILCWWGCEMVQPHWKTVYYLLKNVNIHLPYDPAIRLLGVYPREIKVYTHTGLSHEYS